MERLVTVVLLVSLVLLMVISLVGITFTYRVLVNLLVNIRGIKKHYRHTAAAVIPTEVSLLHSLAGHSHLIVMYDRVAVAVVENAKDIIPEEVASWYASRFDYSLDRLTWSYVPVVYVDSTEPRAESISIQEEDSVKADSRD